MACLVATGQGEVPAIVLPPVLDIEPEPARERYGWYVDREAFGPDLYVVGRRTPLSLGGRHHHRAAPVGAELGRGQNGAASTAECGRRGADRCRGRRRPATPDRGAGDAGLGRQGALPSRTRPRKPVLAPLPSLAVRAGPGDGRGTSWCCLSPAMAVAERIPEPPRANVVDLLGGAARGTIGRRRVQLPGPAVDATPARPAVAGITGGPLRCAGSAALLLALEPVSDHRTRRAGARAVLGRIAARLSSHSHLAPAPTALVHGPGA